jgi:hypothetical protein
MTLVEAPDGFEGCMFFDDGCREYKVSLRRVGDTWWKNVGFAGHAYLTEDERQSRAKVVIARALEARVL